MLKLTAGISKAIRILGTRISSAIAIGRSCVQQKIISRSYRCRTNVARTQTKKNMNRRALAARIRLCRLMKVSCTKISGNA